MSDVINNPRSSELLTDKEILSQIWFSPRKVFKFINDNQYDKHVKLLLVLAGISAAFERAASKDIGDTFSLLGVIGMSIIAGGASWLDKLLYLCCSNSLDRKMARRSG